MAGKNTIPCPIPSTHTTHLHYPLPMTPLADWQVFAQIVGSAAAALTGLQFVAMALLADLPTNPAPDTTDAFASPNIVHFVSILLFAASLAMPWPGLASAALAWKLGSLAGLLYVAVTVRRMFSQADYHPVFEDWLFHALLPVLSYAGLASAAFASRTHPLGAIFGLAAALLLLLVTAIHNAWDNLIYLVFLRNRAVHDSPDGNSTEPLR